MSDDNQSTHKWFILGLSAITGTLVGAIPFSCMPVLFKEISEDLGLSLVQIGAVWGIASLAGVFVSLIAGILGDRFGVKLILGISCLLIGITGALRGLSDSFLTLAITVFIFGLVRAILPVNITKTVGIWFRWKNLGMANGIVGMGMGLGLMLGPLISATILSPLLGGWRNVLFLYGAISVVISIAWFLFGREPPQMDSVDGYSSSVPFRQALSKVIRIKALWFIGLTLMFRIGSIMGMAGYLPLYLRDRGLTDASADGTLASFYAASAICVIPLSFLSDRIGSRKAILFPALLVTIICLGLVPVVEVTVVWVLMIVAGIFMDGFMSVLLTMFLETEGVQSEYSGTALGVVFTIALLGGVFSPPLGNSLASINSGLPFVFWAALSVCSMVTLTLSKETGWRRRRAIESERDVY
ncbi:nitrate/nitrite transporter [Chloroflexota bacterium]